MSTNHPTPEQRGAPEGSPIRRRWRRLILGLVLVNVVVFGVILYYVVDAREALQEIPTTSIPSLGQTPPSSVPIPTTTPPNVDDTAPVSPEEVVLPDTPAEPVTILVLGSDTRDGLPQELGINDRLDGRRADVVMLVAVDEGAVRVLSLPRDLQTDLGEYGVGKLNAAFAFGGAELMVSTVETVTGIEIDHYVELDFYGFATVVDALGGVELTFAYPARDLKSGLDVGAGEQLLDGRQALAYARSRSYQELRGAVWVSVDANDLGRIRRQQSLLYAMLASAQRWTILFDVGDVIRAAGPHMVIDAGLSPERMLDLALTARTLDASDIEVSSLPVRESIVNDVYYLHLNEPEASRIIAEFADGGAVVPAAAPGAIRLRVLNGNGGSQQATGWSGWFATRPEIHPEVRAGDAASFDFVSTVIRVRPSDYGVGVLLADLMGFGLVEVGSVDDGSDAVVILGADALDRVPGIGA